MPDPSTPPELKAVGVASMDSGRNADGMMVVTFTLKDGRHVTWTESPGESEGEWKLEDTDA